MLWLISRELRLEAANTVYKQWARRLRACKPPATWNPGRSIGQRSVQLLQLQAATRRITTIIKPSGTNKHIAAEDKDTQPIGNATCDICRSNPTTKVIPAETHNHGRLWDSNWTSFCAQCYKAYVADRARWQIEVAQEKASRARRLAEMLERVRTTQATERVDLLYANQRLKEAARTAAFFRKPAKRFQKNILDHLKVELDIQRIGNRYTCGKEKADAMDWKLWCLHPYLDIEV